MFACDPTFYRFQNNFYQHRVSVHSIIDFLGGGFGSPPPPQTPKISTPPGVGLMGYFLFRPHRPFWGHMATILDFAGGSTFQAMSECPLHQ